jgi:hypothetical protein
LVGSSAGDNGKSGDFKREKQYLGSYISVGTKAGKREYWNALVINLPFLLHRNNKTRRRK